jgi:purine-binding chemotaxis protein CheW
MADSAVTELVVFRLDELRLALPLTTVERVVRAVHVTRLPQAPEIVLGVVNVQGRIIPVVDPRKRFRLPERAIALADQLVIARTSRRPVALLVDAVDGVLEVAEREAVPALDVLPKVAYVEGVVKQKDGLVLIHDLNKFLSLEEETALDQAMEID